jgi:hypothetical protein
MAATWEAVGNGVAELELEVCSSVGSGCFAVTLPPLDVYGENVGKSSSSITLGSTSVCLGFRIRTLSASSLNASSIQEVQSQKGPSTQHL